MREEHNCDLHPGPAPLGEAVLGYPKTVPVDQVTRSLFDHFMRSQACEAASCSEVDPVSSNIEFFQKIDFWRKKARERQHWLRSIARRSQHSVRRRFFGGKHRSAL